MAERKICGINARDSKFHAVADDDDDDDEER